MAYAALLSLAQTLLQILKHHQSSTFLLDKPQIRSLHKNVIFLQEFLEDFPEKVNSLEGRIRNAANEAEDISEYILSEQIHSLNSNVKSSPHQAGSGRLCHRNFHKQYEKLPKVSEDIKSIVEEVMEIKNSLSIQHLQLMAGDSSPATSSPIQRSDPYTPSSSSMHVPTKKDSMVGFDGDLMAIKTRLCGQSSRLEVIPIFGMGGIGKTTLARNAYDDSLSMQHFDIRAWVTVSQDYSIHDILFSLLSTTKAFNEVFDEEKHSYELMALQVYKNFNGRRYLVVLDDMWSTKAWDDVKRLFPNDHNGSRIILTTRISDVAAYTDPCSPLHEMHLMDVNQSWNLLREKVFKKENCPPELGEVGRQIARSCRGLPLAIVVVAGLLLAVSETKIAWQNIAENVNLAAATNDQFDKILSLSYSHLPHHLRPCFLYMGGFPEDHEIHVSKLIKLWIAEGFLRVSVSKSFEEAAEEYLEDLIKRSLVFVTKRKSNGKIKSCSIHDLLRDLCMRKAQEEKFLLHVMDRYVDKILSGSIKDQRRLSAPRFSEALQLKVYGPAIRTVLVFRHCHRLFGTLKRFRFLRVLDAVRLTFRFFPDEVLELIHLSYLAFTYSETGNFYFPASVVHLRNLETLLIHPSRRDESLRGRVRFPLEIWRMPQLRHLVFFVIDPLPDPKWLVSSASALENLQTLARVANFKCTRSMVQMIPNLKKLGIIYDGDRIEWGLYGLHNLVHLHHLEKLKICVERDSTLPCPLWEKLAFPVTLNKLTLRGCSFRRRDVETVGLLPNLEVLKLKNCDYENCKWETIEGRFPRLKFLQIMHTNLQQWITESDHFPRLQRLMLCHCERLGEIPGAIGEIPTLELIDVSGWDSDLVKSAKQIIEEQQSYGNYSLRLSIWSYYFNRY